MTGKKIFKSRIGTDESGKGDYFGPLVVAGVFIKSRNDEENLKSIGVRDCKKLSDRRIIEIAEIIKKKFYIFYSSYWTGKI